MMENTPNNSNKDTTEGIAKLFLPYKRGYAEKIKRIAKKHGIDFHKRTNFETETLNTKRREIRKTRSCLQREM